uniref:Uncharacterized protein n=1 Tax=Oryza sativa subsp. japonica TaxID=39947 RepID=Q69LK4_ORYSJ|nr:hypothetical protein [Oryza sativa Japonica Group]
MGARGRVYRRPPAGIDEGIDADARMRGSSYRRRTRDKCDVGARLSVQSDVTGVRDQSFLTIARQFSTPHVCPTALNATWGSWGAARFKGSLAWAPSSLAPPTKRRLGEGLGAKQCKGPRGMTWHPEAPTPRPLLRFAECGDRTRL